MRRTARDSSEHLKQLITLTATPKPKLQGKAFLTLIFASRAPVNLFWRSVSRGEYTVSRKQMYFSTELYSAVNSELFTNLMY